MPWRLLLYFPLYFILFTLYFISPARADWSTDFSKPTCQWVNSPDSSQTTGNKVYINLYTNSTHVQGLVVKDHNGVVVAGNPNSPSQPQPASLTWTPTYTDTYIISGTAFNNNTGNLNNTCATAYKITDPPKPADCFNYSWNKAYIWPGGNCIMNWWDNRCSVNLYDWVIPWTITNFYVKAHDYYNNWDWTVCDTRWGSWGLCTRNWTGYSRENVAFNNPYYTLGTKFSIIQRTTNWNNQTVETPVADACVSGYRYQMPGPDIQYDYTLTNNGTCLDPALDTTGKVLGRIYFPTSNPSREINWVDISEDPNFSYYYNRHVPPGATWVGFPSLFNGAYKVSGPLTIKPDHIYYVRLYGEDRSTGWSTRWYNGSYGWWSAVSPFRLPLCAVDGGWCGWTSRTTTCGAGQITQTNCACPAPANGGASCPAPQTQKYEDYTGCTYTWATSGWSACNASCGDGWQYQSVWCKRSDEAIVGDSFCARAGTKPASSQSCKMQSCVTPWVQTEGGDVHSNTRISAPGGP